MRASFTICVLIALAARLCAAECTCGYPNRRPAPCQQCAPQHVHVKIPCDQPSARDIPMQDRGAFAAPPRSGAVAGETESLGLTGGALHIPSFSVRLPSIQLPGFIHFRNGPRMFLDSDEAPFVAETRREYTIDAGPEIRVPREVPRKREAPTCEAPARAAPPAPAPCANNPPQPCAADVAAMQARIVHLEQSLRQMQQAHGQQLRIVTPPMPQPARSPAPVQAPQPAPVRCQDGSCPAASNPGHPPVQRPAPMHHGKPPMEEIPMPLQDSSIHSPAGQPMPLPRSPFQHGTAMHQPRSESSELDPRIAQLTATVARLEQQLHAFQQAHQPAVQHSAYYHPIVDLPIDRVGSPAQIEALPAVR